MTRSGRGKTATGAPNQRRGPGAAAARSTRDAARGIPAERRGEIQPYPLHSTVSHRQWGRGTVLGYDDDRMTVLFDEVGYKTLSVAVVQDNDLLAAGES